MKQGKVSLHLFHFLWNKIGGFFLQIWHKNGSCPIEEPSVWNLICNVIFT